MIPYTVRPGMREEATAHMQELESRIMALSGMISFLNVLGSDRKGYIISVVRSKADSDANAAKVAQLWAEFAPYLEGMPQFHDYEVVALWQNPSGDA